jgi:two-component system response regulator GlrR
VKKIVIKEIRGIHLEGVETFKRMKAAFEIAYVGLVLRESGGNVSRAAEMAGKERKDFYDLMRRCGVSPKAYRS